MIFISLLLALLGNDFPASASHAECGPMQHYASSTHPVSARDSAIESSQDEYLELRNSPSVIRTAHWIGLPLQMTFSLCRAFNFCVMLLLIYWKGWPKVRAAFESRSRLIPFTMEQAQQLAADSRTRLAEIENRFTHLDSEITALRAVAEAATLQQEQALLAATNKDIQRILANSEHEIAAAAERARRELIAFAAGLGTSIASQSVRVDERTDKDLVRFLVNAMEPSIRATQAAAAL
jgi:F0F1-type ATP synthase membrane subunit b/b'